MSEQSQGPGWWIASDGRWYPPDQRPGPVLPPPPPPPPPPAPGGGGMGTGARVAVALAVAFVVLLVGGILAVTLLGRSSEQPFEDVGTAIAPTSTPTSAEERGGPIAPPVVPAGYTLTSGDGVSVAVPERWTVLDSAELANEDLSQVFPDADPEFLQQAAQAFAQGAVFFAADFTTPQFAPNINIARYPGRATKAAIEPQLRAALEQLGGTVGDMRDVALPVGPALRIDYTGVAAASGGVRFEGVQLYVPLGSATYVITVTAADLQPALVDVVTQSFRGA